ncbi:hypothetical protein CM49_02139 [Paenibacillus sp. P1XP2]|nr:hypothetical protein CM49_02139 [Paenibacillus sp. P1XP2]
MNTIGLRLMDPQGSDLLKAIAQETGGQYYDVQNAGDLSPVFQKIYRDAGERTLLIERTGPQENSTLYLIARVVFLALIGAGIGIALGLIFDNRYLARSFGAGGTVSGLLAGLLLEFGLTGEDWKDSIIGFWPASCSPAYLRYLRRSCRSKRTERSKRACIVQAKQGVRGTDLPAGTPTATAEDFKREEKTG